MNTSNQNVSFKGNKLTMAGSSLKVGDAFPNFKLVANDMSDLEKSAFSGKVMIIGAVPSLDTPVCQVETKRFNTEASELSDKVSLLFVSLDLPFAQKRFCGAEGIARLVTASDYKYRTFGEATGTFIKEMGLLCRAIFVVDATGKIAHVEYVPDISQEPQYEAALTAVRKLL